MKHFIFPTVEQANGFVNELKSQDLVKESHHAYNPHNYAEEGFTGRYTGMNYTRAHYELGIYEDADNNGETIADEAVKGAGVGAVTGAAAAVVGAAVAAGGAAMAATTVLTGGLAAPLIGLTLLGTGVGAAVGAAGEAAREADAIDTYDVHEDHYRVINEAYQSGGRAVAVEDTVNQDIVLALLAKYSGRQVG